jgi:hypothetical protein
VELSAGAQTQTTPVQTRTEPLQGSGKMNGL